MSQANGHLDSTVTNLLAELYLTDAAGDLAKTLRSKGKRVAGTCEWVLATTEYRNWVAGDGLQLLWLTGPPGIGKTMISCFLVEQLNKVARESQAVLFAHYFCDDKDGLRRTATAILRGILGQLLRQRPALFRLMEEDYKIKRDSVVDDVDVLWEFLLRMLDGCIGRVYILIDALDECEEQSRSTLLALLKDLKPSVRAHILVTGRPLSDILEVGHEVGVHLCLDSAKVSGDLAKFIDFRVSEIGHRKRYSTEFEDEVRSAVQNRAGGTFLWAALVLGDIATTTMDLIAKEKLGSMPESLSEVYQKILESLKGDDRRYAAFVLRWIVASRRPMRVKELATAAALYGPHRWERDTLPPDAFVHLHRDVFKCCGPLLYHDLDDDTVNLVHQSAKDYLTAMDPQSLYSVNWHEASMDIIKASWKYLAAPEFAHGAAIISRSETNGLKPTKLSKRVLENYGFLGYATKELRDEGLVERLELIAEFVRQSESLSELSVLRDYWLIKLVENGQIEGALALIDKRADTTVKIIDVIQMRRDVVEYSILEVAAWTGDVTLVRRLLSGGCLSRQASQTTPDSSGTTATPRASLEPEYGYAAGDLHAALLVASRKGHIEMCRTLIGNGAEIELSHFRGEKRSSALHAAVARGRKALVALLLEKGARVDYEDEEGIAPLVKALQDGSEDVALHLLDAGANPDLGAGVDFCSPWPEGSCFSYGEGDELTIYSGISRRGMADDDYAVNGEQDIVLYTAATTGCYQVVRRLIERGIDINKENVMGRTALCEAVLNRHPVTARLLLAAGADASWRERDTSKTLLHMAVEGGSAEGFGREYRVTIRLPPLPALDLGTEKDSCAMIRLLFDRGVEVDALASYQREQSRADRGMMTWPSPCSCSALHVATMLGNVAAVQTLLEIGASPHVLADKGKTVVHLAAEFGQASLITCLLDKGCDVSPDDACGRTPLHLAARRGYCAAVDALIARGAHVEEKDCNGWTALHYAVKGSQEAAVLLLIDSWGAAISAQTDEGHTALHIAIQTTFPDDHGEAYIPRPRSEADRKYKTFEAANRICRLLLEKGIDVEAGDAKGRTALQAVASALSSSDIFMDRMLMDSISQSIAQLLLSCGATVAVRDGSGRSALFEAAAAGNRVLACLLLEHLTHSELLAMEDTEWAQYPRAFQLRDLIEKWLVVQQCPAGGSEAERTRVEMLHLLFEMAVYTLADEKPSAELLFEAAEKGYAVVVSMLIGREAAGDVITVQAKSSALVLAAKEGHGDVVRILLEVGVDIDAQLHLPGRTTALQEAARHGHVAVVQTLLNSGANMHVGEIDPISTAAAKGHHRIVEMLLDWELKASHQVCAVQALEYAAGNGHIDTVRMLLDRGVEMGNGLANAVEGRQAAVAELLLGRGANVNGEGGESPMAIALSMIGNTPVVLILLRYEADPQTVGRWGSTLVSWTLRLSEVDFLSLLCQDKEFFNLEGMDGQILLTGAVEKKYEEVVDRLLEKGVKMEVKPLEALLADEVESHQERPEARCWVSSYE